MYETFHCFNTCIYFQVRYVCEIIVCLYCVVNLFFQGEEVKSQGVKGFILAQVRMLFIGFNVN